MKKYCLICFMLVSLSITGLAEPSSQMDFNNAPLLEVVEILAKQTGLDVVISGNAELAQNKRTSVHLSGLSPTAALDHVLQTNGLKSVKHGQVLLITLDQPQPDDQVFNGASLAVDLKYLSADRAEKLVEKIFPLLKAAPAGKQSTIVLQGPQALLAEAQTLINKLDRPLPQILIESEVLELAEADAARLGFSQDNQPGVQLPRDLAVSIRALMSQGRAKVVARPRIATLAGHEAVINIGSRIPYAVPVNSSSDTSQWTVDYIDAGVKLMITPRLGEAGQVTAEIKPEVSSVSQWRTTSAGDFPVISTRNARAVVRVKDGETIVVGGLLSETERVNVSRVPIIGQIPILNFLFQDRTVEKIKTEIVFLITPHVI